MSHTAKPTMAEWRGLHVVLVVDLITNNDEANYRNEVSHLFLNVKKTQEIVGDFRQVENTSTAPPTDH